MRPSTLRLIAGGIAIGGIVGAFTTATARADVADYTVAHANEICGGLDRYPSVPGVMSSFGVAQRNGLTDVESAEAVALAVMAICPQHLPAVERFVAIYTQGSGQ